MYRQHVLTYIKKEYGTNLVHLWQSSPDHEVLRHEAEQGKSKAKRYALIMALRGRHWV